MTFLYIYYIFFVLCRGLRRFVEEDIPVITIAINIWNFGEFFFVFS